jgi:hypothetical protein
LEGKDLSALDALTLARAAGISVRLDGDDLLLEASAPPEEAIIELITSHKLEIVAWLRPDQDGRTAEAWKTLFDERVRIAESDGGLPRSEAEALAVEICVIGWLLSRDDARPTGPKSHADICTEIEKV